MLQDILQKAILHQMENSTKESFTIIRDLGDPDEDILRLLQNLPEIYF